MDKKKVQINEENLFKIFSVILDNKYLILEMRFSAAPTCRELDEIELSSYRNKISDLLHFYICGDVPTNHFLEKQNFDFSFHQLKIIS